MITKIAGAIACFVKSQDDTADVEVLSYGYELILQEICAVLIALLSAAIFGLFLPMLVAIAVYTLMRANLGGAHANSRIVCFIGYTVQLYGVVLISMQIQNRWIYLPVFIFSLLLMAMYAPADTVEQPIVENAMKQKFSSIFFLILLTVASYFIWPYSQLYANILIFMPAVNSLGTSSAAYRLFKCEKHRKELFR